MQTTATFNRGVILLTTTINTFMSAHHKECDDLFAAAENSIASGDWDNGVSQWLEFTNELENHFSREETIIFPEFESKTGSVGGPTQMMRMEHEQMRSLVSELSKAAADKDMEQFLGLSETLMVTMQQHNMKEEQMLYPMIDHAMPDVTDIIARMV
ncbi:MAG: hemerythrin domain-containing protein [gamma proteobacterium symbiont of Taylorina sp.]|nr:hemerythrin domain-containing protein [gamma proteobacterium symbiont of Taylorina sp.]